jgi:hypothetical protein
MRYLQKKDKPNEAILIATTDEDVSALDRMWKHKTLRGAWAIWRGEKPTHESIQDVLKMFPDTKSYILINNS